jgi:hypothetical protein
MMNSNRIHNIIATACVALALGTGAAACSASATSTPAVTSTSATAAPAAATPTVQEVASQIGAAGVQPITPTMYATSEALATMDNGQPVDIATFATQALRDDWLKAATQFGSVETTGPLFAVLDQ